MNVADLQEELSDYRNGLSDPSSRPVVLSDAHKRRSAIAAMLGMCMFKIGLSAFGPPFAELLLQRACAPLGFPYPGNSTDDRCMDSDAAAAVAADHSSVFNLATSIPQLITVSLFAVLADHRGRQMTLLLCFSGSFLQFLVVWLIPPGKACFLGICTDDSFYFIVAISSAVSFLGGWAVALSTSFAVIADVTEGASAATRGTLFGLMESFNIGGSIVGPIASGYLAKEYGLQQSFIFSVVCGALSVLLILFVYKETLIKKQGDTFNWARANPLGSVGLLFTHGILVRFAMLIVTVDMANGAGFSLATLYYTKMAGFGPVENGLISTVTSAALAAGLLVLLPAGHKFLSVKTIIILSAMSSTIALFMNGMLAWHSIRSLFGVEPWAYICAAANVGLALWFPLMRATAATLFGPARFAIALGAVATAQAVNGVVGPSIWPLVYSSSVDHTPALVFYCAAAWSTVGVIIACTFPSLEEDDLAAAARTLEEGSLSGGRTVLGDKSFTKQLSTAKSLSDFSSIGDYRSSGVSSVSYTTASPPPSPAALRNVTSVPYSMMSPRSQQAQRAQPPQQQQQQQRTPSAQAYQAQQQAQQAARNRGPVNGDGLTMQERLLLEDESGPDSTAGTRARARARAAQRAQQQRQVQ